MPRGKGPVNKSTRPINTTSEFGQIMERLQRARTIPGAAESRYLTAAQRAQEELEYVKGRGPDPDQTVAEYYGEVADVGSEAERFREQVRQEQIARQRRYNVEYQQRISRFAGMRASTARIRQDIEEERVMRAGGFNVMEQPGFGSLRRRHVAATKRLEQYRENLGTLAQDPNTSPELLQRAARKVTGTEEEIARTSFAMERMRVERTDPASVYATGMKVQQQLRGEAEFRIGYTGEIGKRQAAVNLESAQTRMNKAWDKFRIALEENAEEVDELSKTYQQAQDEYVSASNIARGAGIDPSRYKADTGWLQTLFGGGISSNLQLAGTALQTTGQLSRFFGVTLPMERMDTQIQYAQLTNRQYNDYKKALIEDDVSSMRRLTGGYNIAREVGQRMRNWERAAMGQENIGRGLTAAGNLAGNFALDPTGAVIGTMQSGAGITQGAARLLTDIQPSRVGAAGYLRALQLYNVINEIPNQTMQSAVNYGFGMGNALVGMGGRMTPMLNTALDVQTLDRLSRVGVGANQFQQLTAMGVQTMGAQFRGVQDVTAAGRARMRGIMAPEQFMQMAGQLSMVGANQTQNLENIIENAFAQGLDKSKNIEQMVTGIISLSQRSAGRGVDIVGGAADAMANTMQFLTNMGVSKNLRAVAANKALQTTNQMFNADEYSLLNVMRIGQIRQQFGNVSIRGMQAAMTVNPGQFGGVTKLLRQGREGEAGALAESLGLGEILTTYDPNGQPTGIDRERLQQYRNFMQTTMRYGVTGFGFIRGTPRDKESINEYFRTGDLSALTKTARQQIEAWGQYRGVSALAIGATSGTLGEGATSTTPESVTAIMTSKWTRTAEAESKPIKAGDNTLRGGMPGTLREGLENWNNLANIMLEQWDPSKWEGAAAASAKEFDTPATNIKAGATIFMEAVEKFASLVGEDTEAIRKRIESATKSDKSESISRHKMGLPPTGASGRMY